MLVVIVLEATVFHKYVNLIVQCGATDLKVGEASCDYDLTPTMCVDYESGNCDPQTYQQSPTTKTDAPRAKLPTNENSTASCQRQLALRCTHFVRGIAHNASMSEGLLVVLSVVKINPPNELKSHEFRSYEHQTFHSFPATLLVAPLFSE